MKTIGLIGGMSWESTRLYYDAINVEVRSRLGGLHSAACILHSLDFAPIADMQSAGRWDEAGGVLAGAARGLEQAGAELIGLCTNTMHKVADHITAAISVPFVHIAEATVTALRRAGRHAPYLMATRFTMEEEFYTGLLRAHGLAVMVPEPADRLEVHRIIYEELCRGDVRPASRATYEALTAKAKRAGADSVLLGCTEVGMLLTDDNAALPTFDTTLIHARTLVDLALMDDDVGALRTCPSTPPRAAG
jgi:aspartate racemase